MATKKATKRKQRVNAELEDQNPPPGEGRSREERQREAFVEGLAVAIEARDPVERRSVLRRMFSELTGS